MYIGNTYGIHEQGFNFSTKERFCLKIENGVYTIRKDGVSRDSLPDGFWGKNVSELNLLIGSNGSGKTTVMQTICQWVSILSRGCLPQDKGIFIFKENDNVGYVAFEQGQKLDIVSNVNMQQYTQQDLISFFKDIRLIYFSDSMAGLKIEKFKNLSDYSRANRIREANASETAVHEDVIENYNQYEFNSQIENALDDVNFPIKYLCMEINLSFLEEIEKELPSEYTHIVGDIKELWELYFDKYNCEDVYNQKSLGIELLQAVFFGIVTRFIKWEKRNTATTDQKNILMVLEKILNNELTMVDGTGMSRGKELIKHFITNLLRDSSDAYERTVYKEKFRDFAKDNIEDSINRFIEFIFEYIEQDSISSLKEWRIKERLEDKRKSIWQWELKSENRIFLKEFWNLYRKIASYVEYIYLYWDASSGERNWANLFSALNKFEEDDTNIWLLLDEPDISFHPEWKRELIKKILEACNGERYGNRFVQAWISTHSPIMLSDVPGIAVTYLKQKEKYVSPFEETFAQNIYVLFNSAFILEKGVIGAFATDKILDVLLDLKEIEGNLLEGKENLSELEKRIIYNEKLVTLVAEPVFKNQMEKYLSKCKKLLRMKLKR